MWETPIQLLEENDSKCNKLYIKRDDLIPFSFGGNKCRIAKEYFDDLFAKECDCIITYGSTKSNLNRIIANMAAMKKIECHIIVPDDDGKYDNTNNIKLSEISGAHICRCCKKNVSEFIENKIIECKKNGKRAYYIYGNKYGLGNEDIPVSAYHNEYIKIKEWQNKSNITFDYIFLAVGTGMTYAGLESGRICNNGNEKIIGISIARDKKKEIPIIENYIQKYLKDNKSEKKRIFLYDDYVGMGYGSKNPNVNKIILEIYTRYGIAMDSTYVGKAFWGMKEIIEIEKINNSNILFVHTGGSPLFFDEISNYIVGKNT